MKHQVLDSPDFGLLKTTFEAPGERLVSEAGAMVAMSSGLKMDTNMRGGLLAAAKRKLLGGESMFQNTYVATAAGQEVWLAPAPEGDIRHRRLGVGETLFLQSGAYVAHFGDKLQLDTKWGGVRSFFGGIGFFLLRVVGPGDLFFYSYGAIHEVDVGGGGYACDTGHVVAFTDGLEYEIHKFGGFKGLFFSGEGLICRFRGEGKLFLQTRNAPSLAAFLEPFRPVKTSSSD
ncbi:MAG: TIGR00266 family protein [Deltaproteobacteria bacterium]|nr:TIGR00266 family protein [Deltaproteobacteria bacterium]